MDPASRWQRHPGSLRLDGRRHPTMDAPDRAPAPACLCLEPWRGNGLGRTGYSAAIGGVGSMPAEIRESLRKMRPKKHKACRRVMAGNPMAPILRHPRPQFGAILHYPRIKHRPLLLLFYGTRRRRLARVAGGHSQRIPTGDGAVRLCPPVCGDHPYTSKLGVRSQNASHRSPHIIIDRPISER
jgi:hypothetical protein